MADKQLTVAELMARAQQDNPDAQPRRRRRRSLDEGGVSVAELTGSLKAVDARPAEVKHSSVPIDSDAKPADPAQPAQPPQPSQSAPSTQSAPKPAASKKIDVKPEKAAPEDKTTTTTQAEKVAPAQPKPVEKPAKPAVKSPVPERPAQPTLQPKAEAASRDSFKAVAPQPSKTEQTGPISRVVSLGDRPAADQSQQGGTLTKERGDVAKPAFREPEADSEVTQESPVVRDEHMPEEPVYRNDAPAEVEVDNSVNPIMLVLLVFAGLVVGVLMFLGFQYLWSSLNPFLAGVLALAVTGGVVMLVRAMKTGRDALTMTLAALAGAVMTFGPALVTAV